VLVTTTRKRVKDSKFGSPGVIYIMMVCDLVEETLGFVGEFSRE